MESLCIRRLYNTHTHHNTISMANIERWKDEIPSPLHRAHHPWQR
jgi:hypothetical protein